VGWKVSGPRKNCRKGSGIGSKGLELGLFLSFLGLNPGSPLTDEYTVLYQQAIYSMQVTCLVRSEKWAIWRGGVGETFRLPCVFPYLRTMMRQWRDIFCNSFLRIALDPRVARFAHKRGGFPDLRIG
jgi:hypothetical protein